MKYKNFLLRAVNLLLILGVLWQYQQVALIRAAAVSQRKQEIAEVEAYNASVLQAFMSTTGLGLLLRASCPFTMTCGTSTTRAKPKIRHRPQVQQLWPPE